MADSAFTFDTDIAFTPDNQMVLTGTADSSVAKIELTNTATNTDLGSAQISNGTWSFSQNIGTGTESFISAQVTDTSGKTTTVTDETAAFTNLKNTPYPNITEILRTRRTLLSKVIRPMERLECTGPIRQLKII